MSENNLSSEPDSDSEYQAYHDYEIATLALLPTMPQEVQDRVFKFCDMLSCCVLCLLNKDWHKKATPLLWRNIDFFQAFDYEGVVEASRKFFVMCDTMMDEEPERFTSLASNVHTLNVGRLHGINIVRQEWDWDDDPYWLDDLEGDRNVFDVIAQFTNLDTLSIYIKNWCSSSSSLSLEASGKALARGITNLKHLKIGGQISTDILLGLFKNPEKLQQLSLFNLTESVYQDSGPDGVLFLSGIYDRFTSLETLHLCKYADLDGRLSDDEDEENDGETDDRREYVSGMQWRFPRESEISVLGEWASLLRHTSSTLEELTLENRYLCSGNFSSPDSKTLIRIDPGNTHPADYGAFSIRESQRALFPVLSDEWPKLKKLTLIGMGAVEDVTQAVCHFEPQVHIEQCCASIEVMEGSVTPDQISTPEEFKGY